MYHWRMATGSISTTADPLGSDSFLRTAEALTHDTPIDRAVDALLNRSTDGAVLAGSLPIGTVPRTPLTARRPPKPDQISEMTLLGAAMRIGEPVGFAQEHGGDIVQDLYPLASSVGRQLSTSSGVELAFHTETAFHPHKPRYLLLLCLRGDSQAATTVCSVDDIANTVSPATLAVLREPRFRCGVDESFGHGSAWMTDPSPIITQDDRGNLAITFDGELSIGIDSQAEDAVAEVNAAIARTRSSVTLDSRDLLLIDNQRVVHGRSPFTARFDGTDRWLQRAFVVGDLAPSANERNGRVITTTFA